MMGNASMVFSLEQILYVEDKNLLSGHILVLLGQDFDAAQASTLLCWCVIPKATCVLLPRCGFKLLHMLSWFCF